MFFFTGFPHFFFLKLGKGIKLNYVFMWAIQIETSNLYYQHSNLLPLGNHASVGASLSNFLKYVSIIKSSQSWSSLPLVSTKDHHTNSAGALDTWFSIARKSLGFIGDCIQNRPNPFNQNHLNTWDGSGY